MKEEIIRNNKQQQSGKFYLIWVAIPKKDFFIHLSLIIL